MRYPCVPYLFCCVKYRFWKFHPNVLFRARIIRNETTTMLSCTLSLEYCKRKIYPCLSKYGTEFIIPPAGLHCSKGNKNFTPASARRFTIRLDVTKAVNVWNKFLWHLWTVDTSIIQSMNKRFLPCFGWLSTVNFCVVWKHQHITARDNKHNE
jgi:hypothetical protein